MFFKTSATIYQECTDSIISTIHEPLIILDRNLRVLSASRSFYDIFMLKAEETEGRIIYDLGDNQWDIPGLRDLLENILLSESAYENCEIDNVFPDAGRRVILLNARKIQIKSDKDRVILLAINDITSKRIYEEKLGKLAVVDKSAGDAIIVINPEGIIESWNKGAESAYGYKAGDVTGRSISLLMFPGYSNEYKELLVRGSFGEPSQMYETQRINKNGEKVNVLLIISPVKNKSGIVIGDSIVARDIVDSSESETTIPAPNSRQSWRKGRSVYPARGARIKGESRVRLAM